MEQKIRIQLDGGAYLVAESSTDPSYPNEIYLGIEKDGVWVQDVAVVMQNYQYDADGEKHYENACEVHVYDEGSDKPPQSFVIPI